MRVGVLAHVEGREVEAERLDLTDEVRQPPTLGDRRRAVLRKAVPHEAQIREKLRSVPVGVVEAAAPPVIERGPSPWRGPARGATPCG